jgi:alpha-ribazole phosphatase/probable phosphoglycerate mutase
MNCRVFLIRHGETVWNAEMKFQGHQDVPLSDKGLKQARSLAGRLREQEIAAVYASDLGRAVQTASELAVPRGLEINTVPALREINFGAWEGLTFKEVKHNYSGLLQEWWANPLATRIPGGECLSDLVVRVTGALKEIIAHNKNRQVAVVCHGGPVRALVASVLGMDLNENWRIRQDNAALNIIDFASWEKGILVLLNDRSHLENDLFPGYRWE